MCLQAWHQVESATSAGMKGAARKKYCTCYACTAKICLKASCHHFHTLRLESVRTSGGNNATKEGQERNISKEPAGVWKKRWQRWWGTRKEPSHEAACPPPSSFRILLLVPSEVVLSVVPLIDLSAYVMKGADNVEFLCCILKVSTVASHPAPVVSHVHAHWRSAHFRTHEYTNSDNLGLYAKNAWVANT